ncbi:alpha/beta fold hydrolase [Streptomyces gardneri]|uniref:alpha/beta fold hydrolase n=1 Tax=Streptomyces gardneri TaxID=66892 RepID=UPI0037D53335
MFQAGGADTHTVVAGSGGPTVVVVPGTNFTAAACLPLATALAARYRTVLVDVPGQPGLSSGERGLAEGRLDWYGAWLSDVITACASGPVIVLGHSFGAAIALSSASPRIDGQILVSPGGLTGLRLTPGVLLPPPGSRFPGHGTAPGCSAPCTAPAAPLGPRWWTG